MSGAFANVQRGKLKLKGAARPTPSPAVPAASAASAAPPSAPPAPAEKRKRTEPDAAPVPADAPAPPAPMAPPGPRKTASQLAHEAALARRAAAGVGGVSKAAAKSYRERVDDYNAHLLKAPEHNQIFNVSYTA